MADGTTETVINCPACQTPLTIPVRLEMRGRSEGAVGLDLNEVQQHVADHDKTTCTATITVPYADITIRCTQPTGHYDEQRMPDPHAEGEHDIGGWHAVPAGGGNHVWCDRADGATPADPKDTP